MCQFSQEWILDRHDLSFISHKLLQQYHFERVLFKLDSLERERTIISMNTNQTFVYLGQRQLLGVVDGASGPESSGLYLYIENFKKLLEVLVQRSHLHMHCFQTTHPKMESESIGPKLKVKRY